MIHVCERCGADPLEARRIGGWFIASVTIVMYRVVKTPDADTLTLEPILEQQKLCLPCASKALPLLSSNGAIAAELREHVP